MAPFLIDRQTAGRHGEEGGTAQKIIPSRARDSICLVAIAVVVREMVVSAWCNETLTS